MLRRRADKNKVDDVGFIREVIQRVERQASIDPQPRLRHGHVERRDDDLAAGVRSAR